MSENPLPSRKRKKSTVKRKPVGYRLGKETLDQISEMVREGYSKTEVIEHGVDLLYRSWKKYGEQNPSQ